MEPRDDRQQLLETWLHEAVKVPMAEIYMLPHDASFRRYFRVKLGGQSFIAMDAPPEKEHNCHAFISIGRALKTLGLETPEIIESDLARGFLLLTDFGTLRYLDVLNVHNAEMFYGRALEALAVLQSCRQVPGREIPLFTADWMHREWQWFQEWFVERYLGLSMPSSDNFLQHCFEQVVSSAVAQPQVFMHRDFHSANLMVLDNTKVGILDFQDAFIGPVTYDLVSLLRDCYIAWPNERVISWVQFYWNALTQLNVIEVPFEIFLKWFDWMGVERHLKALFTFARKKIRDQTDQYEQHIPRILTYLSSVTQRYPELMMLSDYLQEQILPAYTRKKGEVLCAQ